MEALFTRYCFDGEDFLSIHDMVTRMLGLAANPVATSAIRESCACVRSSLSSSQGLAGVTAVLASLQQSSTGAPDRVPVLAARQMLLMAMPGVPQRHVDAILREAAKPGLLSLPGATVSVGGLSVMLQGGMSRRRRHAVDAAWGALAGHGSMAVPTSTVLSAYKEQRGLSRDALSQLLDGPLAWAHGEGVVTAGPGMLTWQGWLQLHKDVAAGVQGEEQWERFVSDAWGVRVHWDERDHILPFTPLDTVRRLGGGGSLLPPAKTLASYVAYEGSLTRQVGMVLGNTLQRPTDGLLTETFLMSPRRLQAGVPQRVPFGPGARGPFPAHKEGDVPPVNSIMLAGVVPKDPARGSTAASAYMKERHVATRYVGSMGGDTLGLGTTYRNFL